MVKARVSDEATGTNGRERRGSERRPMNAAVRIVLARSRATLPGRLRDLSCGGAYLLTDLALWPGEEVAFGLALDDGGIGVASGHVVRVDGRGVGVRLHGMNPALRALVAG
jgi:hypothetical protein